MEYPRLFIDRPQPTVRHQIIHKVFSLLRCKKLTTIAYQMQADAQVDFCNRTLLARLRHRVLELQKYCEKYVQPLNFSYNTQRQRVTATSPFNMTILRKPTFASILQRLTGLTNDMERELTAQKMPNWLWKGLR